MGTPEPRQFAPRAFVWLQWIGLGATIIGARLWLISVYASPLPIHDQWDGEAAFLFKPWLEGHLGWADFFGLHNEHRIVLSRLLALGLLRLNGQWDAQLEMVANTVLCGVIGLAVTAAARRFFSQQRIVWITAAVTLWLALPYAQENTLWGFQSCFYFLLIFSLVAMWGLGSDRAFSLRWWFGGISAVLACFTMASGFLAAAVVLLLMAMRFARQRTWSAAQTVTTAWAVIVMGVGYYLHRGYTLPAASKAVSPLVWANVFGQSLAWPFCHTALLAVLMYSPLGWLAVLQMKQPQSPGNADARQRQTQLLLALGIWVVLQAAAVAYSRGGDGSEQIASRYMDILALGALVNAGAVALLLDALPWRRTFRLPCYLWLVALVMGAAFLSSKQLSNQTWRQGYLRSAEQNVRAYVATGDRRYVDGDPLPAIPYPDPARLIELLDDPSIREILPAAVRPALRVEAGVAGGGAFVPGGYPPEIINPAYERSWGSYSAQGAEARGTMESLTLTPRLSHLQIELAGYLREGMTLDLRSATGARQTRFIPTTRIDQGWRAGFIPLPASAVTFVAHDENPRDWFAFREPREVGRFSIYAEKLVAKGAVVCVLGLTCLMVAFVLGAVNAFTKRWSIVRRAEIG